MIWRSLPGGLFSQRPLQDRVFEVCELQESALERKVLDALIAKSSSIGISGTYVPSSDPKCLADQSAALLTKIAIASSEQVVIIQLGFDELADHSLLWDTLFAEDDSERPECIGFNIERLALRLYADYGLYLRTGVDAYGRRNEDIDQSGIEALLKHQGEDERLFNAATLHEILTHEEDGEETNERLARRAWGALMLKQANENLAAAISSSRKVDILHSRSHDERMMFAKALLDSDRLRGQLPDFVTHEIRVKRRGGTYFAFSEQFNTRVRNTKQEFEITFESGLVVRARIKGVQGKSAELVLSESIDLKEAGDVQFARTLAKESATSLDNQRNNIILYALQDQISFLENPSVARIWFPHVSIPPSVTTQESSDTPVGAEYAKLNKSQKEAVRKMLRSQESPNVVLIHGPPGTGKTSVIAAMTQSLLESDPDATLYLVAQSNVAVKNIAEKLTKIGLTQFKLLVSHEFHYEWHEHLYLKLAQTIQFNVLDRKNPDDLDDYFKDIRVILCTLSMITSPRMRSSGIIQRIPVQNVVVDEASQIQLGDLLPLMHHHGRELRRLCFVGDHKQLAPYGQDEIPGLESIFEKKHLQEGAQLLDITYRLPHYIWLAISHLVYDGKLQGNHPERRMSCLRLIDVAEGKEDTSGQSCINQREADAVVLIVRELARKGKDYRVISPYAAQTSLILKMLKEEAQHDKRIKYDDTCFNVDSFQGNEADYIVVSLVRTEKFGFLDNNRRANVLLTRCKKGMFICANRELVLSTGPAAEGSIFGNFARRWSGEGWVKFDDLMKGMEVLHPDIRSPVVSGRQGKRRK